MVRRKGKIRKQSYRSKKQLSKTTTRSQEEYTRATTSPERVRAVGDGKLRFVGTLPSAISETLGGGLPTFRVAISDYYFNQHVRAPLRRRFGAKARKVIETPDYAGQYKSGSTLQRLTLVKELKSGEFLGVGLDLAEDAEGLVYVISTLRKERGLAFERRVEGIGKIGMERRLKQVQK